MATVKLILRRILEHRARQLTVLTITLIIALGGVVLAADKYFGLRQEAEHLRDDLATAIADAGQLDDLQRQLEQVDEQLQQRVGQAVDDGNIDIVRDEIVMLILDSKCKFRRVEINDAQTRSYSAGDDALQDSRTEEDDLLGPRSGYDLRSQESSVEVTGKLENIKHLLAKIHDMKRLVRVNGLQLTQEATTNEIQLRANLVFFGLQESKRVEGEERLPPPLGGEAEPPPRT